MIFRVRIYWVHVSAPSVPLAEPPPSEVTVIADDECDAAWEAQQTAIARNRAAFESDLIPVSWVVPWNGE